MEALENAIDAEMMRRAMAEHDGEFATIEEVIEGYNKLHVTDLTIENIINY
ncbi:MAG TPA: hypothetical protein V6D28_19505 [Leptolyngbyaceae cyanobacterium]